MINIFVVSNEGALGMSWKLPIVAIFVVGLQAGEILILGTSPAGSLAANSLQLVACAIGAAMAFGASLRGRGLSRPFWRLIGLGLATWGVANLGWMYYENYLHTQPPPISVVRMLFDSQGVFFAIALFLDKEKDSPRFDAETLLDSLQIAIVFFSAFFGLYYVQVLSRVSVPGSELLMTWTFQAINVALTLAAVIATLSVRTRRLRSLYGGLTIFLLINAISSGIADYLQSVRNVPTGTWCDIGWSLPFLACAIWASRWQEPAEEKEETAQPQSKTLGALAVRNVMLALAPLIVLVVVAQL